MPGVRFLQIHTLSSYAGAILNRDDGGFAKRLPYGGVLRTRISSQCLKRHWRTVRDPHSLDAIEGSETAWRSRELVARKVIDPLRGRFPEDVTDALEPEIQMAVYGGKGTERESRPVLLLGAPEIRWLAREAERLAGEAGGNAKTAGAAARKWRTSYRANMQVMRRNAALPAGLASALFGRMVTSDPDANIAAAVHVAHAFTVHAEEQESDFLAAVDDLMVGGPGAAASIQESELASGLYYGYVVVDLPGLLGNLGSDAGMAAQVLHNLVHLIAEVSPGARLGSTAPYGRAEFMLLEVGDRQPRSLAGAYREPCAPQLAPAVAALGRHLADLDAAYATGEERRAMSLVEAEIPGAARGSLADLAQWARSLPKRMEDS